MNNSDLFVETSVDTAPISVSTAMLAEDILSLAAIAQQAGQELDEITLSAKFGSDGRLLLTNGQGGITLRFRRPVSSASYGAAEARGGVSDRYGVLRSLLASGQWQEANQATWDLFCQALSKPTGSFLVQEDMEKIPCDVIQMIDRLWQEYSQGQFGFAVQKNLYK